MHDAPMILKAGHTDQSFPYNIYIHTECCVAMASAAGHVVVRRAYGAGFLHRISESTCYS